MGVELPWLHSWKPLSVAVGDNSRTASQCCLLYSRTRTRDLLKRGLATGVRECRTGNRDAQSFDLETIFRCSFLVSSLLVHVIIIIVVIIIIIIITLFVPLLYLGNGKLSLSCIMCRGRKCWKMTEHTSGKNDRSRRKTGFLSGLVVFPPSCCMIRPFPVLHFPSTPFYRGGNRIQTCKHVAANHQPLTNS